MLKEFAVGLKNFNNFFDFKLLEMHRILGKRYL